MSSASNHLERQRLLRIAREYQEKGYQVVVEPQPADLPEFLVDYEPDLIARNGKEAVVVEVKSHATLSKSPYLPALAQALQDRPGWCFELVVTNPRRRYAVEENYASLTPADVAAQIGRVRQLTELGSHDAALLLLWSAVEATMRIVGGREGITTEGQKPLAIPKTLVALGLLDRGDYSLLEVGFKLRSPIAHGYQATAPNSDLINSIIEIVQRLLKPQEQMA